MLDRTDGAEKVETAVDVEDMLDLRDWDWELELERACDFWMGEVSASWKEVSIRRGVDGRRGGGVSGSVRSTTESWIE